ncbi:MAG: dTDP-glucose 4,6-dehydratase [Chlamydiales bacterium]|nr:dTDP-glucose 4,6-dehydratase [Chlamydiales bacterium]
MECRKRSNKRVLITGGAGFMGSAFIRQGLKSSALDFLINLDLLSYAGNLKNLEEIEGDARYRFVRGDIADEKLVESLCIQHQIDTIVHFAAETHVDRSIAGPAAFLETNVAGTFHLLEVVRRLPHIHFHQISTDEVFGSLDETGVFTESSRYEPNSPYSASKAAADHFVRSYAHTFGLSVTISHSTNNYGPHQYPEKFIPRMITHCINQQSLPVYGSGRNVRDWLYVDDHAEAVWEILKKGQKGEAYNIGSSCERSNLELLGELLDEVAKQTGEDPSCLRQLITFVPDRLGHDFRYALNTEKIRREIGWKPRHTLKEGLAKTVSWYLQNKESALC